MSSFNRIIIDKAALVHNFRCLQEMAGEDARLMAMVKSDAYGHSMVNTAAILSEHGCSLFGVAELEEGAALREAGCSAAIFIFLGFDHRDIDYLYSHDLTPVVFTVGDLERIATVNKEKGASLEVYLKFD